MNTKELLIKESRIESQSKDSKIESLDKDGEAETGVKKEKILVKHHEEKSQSKDNNTMEKDSNKNKKDKELLLNEIKSKQFFIFEIYSGHDWYIAFTLQSLKDRVYCVHGYSLFTIYIKYLYEYITNTSNKNTNLCNMKIKKPVCVSMLENYNIARCGTNMNMKYYPWRDILYFLLQREASFEAKKIFYHEIIAQLDVPFNSLLLEYNSHKDEHWLEIILEDMYNEDISLEDLPIKLKDLSIFSRFRNRDVVCDYLYFNNINIRSYFSYNYSYISSSESCKNLMCDMFNYGLAPTHIKNTFAVFNNDFCNRSTVNSIFVTCKSRFRKMKYIIIKTILFLPHPYNFGPLAEIIYGYISWWNNIKCSVLTAPLFKERELTNNIARLNFDIDNLNSDIDNLRCELEQANKKIKMLEQGTHKE